MRANFVDTLLARLDGEIATIWITVTLRIDAPPERKTLLRALEDLVRETERLNLAFDDDRRAFLPAPRPRDQIESIFIESDSLLSEPETIERVLTTRIDLARDIPLRLHLHPMCESQEGAYLFAIQLHHAIGDAKALGLLIERLWQHYAGHPERGAPLGPSLFSDSHALFAALRHPRAILGLKDPRRRLLSPRGLALHHSGDRPGPPILATASFDLDEKATSLPASDIFFAAILAAIALHQDGQDEGIVRLRMPVDLRRALGLGRMLGNGCSAIPIEIPLRDIRARLHAPDALAQLARMQIDEAIATGVPLTTALETMAVALVAPRATLRKNARPGLVAERRTNTLVVTYLGRLDRHFEDAPFAIRSMRGHTPTWGVTGFGFRGRLMVNVACFEGLWSKRELLTFTERLADFVSRGFGLDAQIIAP